MRFIIGLILCSFILCCVHTTVKPKIKHVNSFANDPAFVLLEVKATIQAIQYRLDDARLLYIKGKSLQSTVICEEVLGKLGKIERKLFNLHSNQVNLKKKQIKDLIFTAKSCFRN